MSADLVAALCLVLVLEGLLLFAAPGLWKQAVAQLLERGFLIKICLAMAVPYSPMKT